MHLPALLRLGQLAAAADQSDASVMEALQVVREEIHAREAALVYVTPNGFQVAGEFEQDFTPTALWLIQRDLTSHPGIRAFERVGSRVVRFRDAGDASELDYVSMLLPIPGMLAAQMFIARGPWRQGLSFDEQRFITAAMPALALMLQWAYYAEEALRERQQLNALMNVSDLVSESGDLEHGLSNIARAVASVASVDFVTIDLVNESRAVELRAVNYDLPESIDGDAWKRSWQRPDALRDQVLRTQRSITIDDAANDERLHPAARSFFARVLVRSVAIIPLVEKGRTIGAYSIGATRLIDFDRATVELLEGIARQVATVVSGVRLYNELAEKSNLLTRALETEREHARRDSLTGVLNHAAITELVRNAAEARPNDYFSIAMVDVDGMKAVNDTYGHVSGDSVLKTIADCLDHSGAVVGRYGGDEFLVMLPGAHRGAAEAYREKTLELISECKVVDRDTSASIRMKLSIGTSAFPSEAPSLADLIASADRDMYAIKSMHAFTDGTSGRRLDERVSNIISDLVPLLTSTGVLDEKLKLVATRLSTGTGYDAVDCQIFDDGGPMAESTLNNAQEDMLSVQWLEEQRKRGDPRGREINVILSRTRRPIILEDLSSDERLSAAERKLLELAGLQSAIVVPMLWENNLIGTLSVAKRQKAAFGVPDAQFLSAVASQVTGMVRMATLIDGMQHATQRLSDAQTETVLMLAAAAEAHDSTTGRHLSNLRALSETLAREMGYDDERVHALGLAATLHDIGKISVPDAVLSSSVRFDSDDLEIAAMRAVMERHSVWGAEFLAGRPGFELATQVARWHHERWDGTGYPDGLAGPAIPQEVTIVSVADAFDAMVSDRPYRAGRPVSDAVREIVSWSGRQFNPDVVQALVRAWERGLFEAGQEGELQEAA